LAAALGTTREGVVLLVLFTGALVLDPVLLVGGAALGTRVLTGSAASVWDTIRSFAFGLVPLGIGIWAAHYGFHALTGIWTWIPAVARLVADLTGRTFLRPGAVMYGLSEAVVYPMEVGLIALGLLGSLLTCYQIAARVHPQRSLRAM